MVSLLVLSVSKGRTICRRLNKN